MKFLIFFLLPFIAISQKTSYFCGSVNEVFTVSCTTCPPSPVFEWTSPSNVTTTGATVNVTVPGVWTWSISGGGCNPVTGTHLVVVEPQPTVTINANDICISTSQTITATGVPGGYNYSWNFGTGATPSTSTTASNSVSYSSTGAKTINLSISKNLPIVGLGECGGVCTWNFTKGINVNEIAGTSSCRN